MDKEIVKVLNPTGQVVLNNKSLFENVKNRFTA